MGKKEHLLFVAFDAGGASCLSPVIEKIGQEGRWKSLIFAAGPAKKVFQSRLPGKKIIGRHTMEKLAAKKNGFPCHIRNRSARI